MSEFIRKLSRISQGGPQPIGFKAGQAVSPKPKMLLVASLAPASVHNVADYVAGADAGLLRISRLGADTKVLREYSEAVPDIPWGGWLRDMSQREMKQVKRMDCDFVVFPADTSLTILQNDEVGKILEVEASLDEGLLRTIDGLPVDAVLIAGEQKKEDSFLTWHNLMLFGHFANSLAKPVLVSVPSGVMANELRVLWEAGVDGVVVEAGVSGLKELRQTVDGLTFPQQRRRRKAEVLLPYISAEPDRAIEEE